MSNELQSTQASRVCSTFAAVASNLFLAVVVARVNLHVHFILCVWIRHSWHLIILDILKGYAISNTWLNPMKLELIGEKNRRSSFYTFNAL